MAPLYVLSTLLHVLKIEEDPVQALKVELMPVGAGKELLISIMLVSCALHLFPNGWQCPSETMSCGWYLAFYGSLRNCGPGYSHVAASMMQDFLIRGLVLDKRGFMLVLDTVRVGERVRFMVSAISLDSGPISDLAYWGGKA